MSTLRLTLALLSLVLLPAVSFAQGSFGRTMQLGLFGRGLSSSGTGKVADTVTYDGKTYRHARIWNFGEEESVIHSTQGAKVTLPNTALPQSMQEEIAAWKIEEAKRKAQRNQWNQWNQIGGSFVVAAVLEDGALICRGGNTSIKLIGLPKGKAYSVGDKVGDEKTFRAIPTGETFYYRIGADNSVRVYEAAEAK